MTDPNRGGRLVVLQSVPRPRPTTNPYVVQLIAALQAAGVTVQTFSWRRALTGSYDVFHVHWPENLARGGRPAGTLARQLALLVLLVRLRLTGTPIVRTLHNTSRHEEGSRREAWLMRLVDRWTRHAIVINPRTRGPQGLATTTILHGHYRDWYMRFSRPEPVPGRLAYFGLIRAYKGVEELISAFREVPGDGLSLSVSGSPRTTQLAAELQRRAAGDDRITLQLSYLDDAQLVRRVGEAEVVVLPYRQMHNSGAALGALSMDRPVLVPANPVNADLAAEVGPGWVHTFTGPMTADVLSECVQALKTVERSAAPDLSGRGWSSAGEQHRAAYLAALERKP